MSELKMTDLDDILATVDQEQARLAYEKQREELQPRLANLAVSYRLEEANPSLTGEDRTKTLSRIEEEIRVVAWAIEEINRRLKEAEEALTL